MAHRVPDADNVIYFVTTGSYLEELGTRQPGHAQRHRHPPFHHLWSHQGIPLSRTQVRVCNVCGVASSAANKPPDICCPLDIKHERLRHNHHPWQRPPPVDNQHLLSCAASFILNTPPLNGIHNKSEPTSSQPSPPQRVERDAEPRTEGHR